MRWMRAACREIIAMPKPGSKYYPLYQFLVDNPEDIVRLTFPRIEAILGSDLPSTATKSKAFWSNRSRGGLQASGWLNADYRVVEVDLEYGEVVFQRRVMRYEVRKKGGTILWHGGMVRALRAHLGMSQAEMAELLGVRQQTVSEWENEVYLPTRGRSNHLTMVAEKAGFYTAYEAEEDSTSAGRQIRDESAEKP
jgi:hypothetical protein